METREKSCGAILIRNTEQLQVLVIRQNDGHWGFPKGHVEKDETEQETACREVQEETGLEISIREGFREETHYCPRPGVFKDVIYFMAEPIGGVEHMQEEEIRDLKWLNVIDALAVLTYGNDVALLKSAVRYLKEHDSEAV